MKKKNEQKSNDGSVAGCFLGLLFGLLIPNVAVLCRLSGETTIFISLIALLCGFVWTNENLPAKSVDDVDGEHQYVMDDESVLNDDRSFVGVEVYNKMITSSGIWFYTALDLQVSRISGEPLEDVAKMSREEKIVILTKHISNDSG